MADYIDIRTLWSKMLSDNPKEFRAEIEVNDVSDYDVCLMW